MEPREHQLFQKLEEFPVIICRSCQHGVWPPEIIRHLKGNAHGMKHADTVQIHDAVQQWEGIAQQADAVVIPHHVDQALSGLPTYPDGMLCQRDYPRCQYIGCSVHSMRAHWRSVHGWSRFPRGGRIRREQRIQQEAELRRSYIIVTCQQIFPSRTGSHFIHVRAARAEEPSIPMDAADIDAAVGEVMTAWEEAEAEKVQQTVQAVEVTDANPWLQVTGWTQYLQDIAPQDMLHSVDPPDPESMDPIEQGIRRLWDTMEQVVRKSQRTVDHSGQAICIEAVRSETGQTPYRPLQVYMDAESIVKHVQPWQQIVAFIARTQAPHTWKSPSYGMTPRQRKKWRQLWQLAIQPDPELMESRHPEEVPWEMSRIEYVCLDFCIELLNQRPRSHEYESVLVCAMAVLGRGPNGWQTPETYPPVLSRVIKVARMMIVQKALWLDPHPEEIIAMWRKEGRCADWVLNSADDTLAEIYTDEGYGSSEESQWMPPSSPPTSPMARGDPPAITDIPSGAPSRPKTFQEQVQWMVQRFMVRGTHGPMQTLQDWRTFGLRIHYNTTSPGHVTWMHRDRLLYQHIQFTMGDFRGMVHGLVGATREILCELLCVKRREAMPAIPWQGLYDDPTQGKAGWNFLQDSRTSWPVVGRSYMIQRVRAEPSVQVQFTVRRQPRRLHAPAVMRYLHRVARFKEKLAVLIHMVAGQPSRAPELLSIQHSNTETNRRRNVYIEDGMVTLVTAYHKGFYASNDVKIIHRYVPQEVGELIVWYLWLVLPFVQQLEAWYRRQTSPGSSPRGAKAREAHMWGPDPGTQRVWTSERFREVLKRETSTRLGQAINIAAYRDIAIGISRRFMRPSSAFASNVQEERELAAAALNADAEDGMDEEQWMSHIADLQAAHSSHLAGMVYARGIMEQAGTTEHRRAMFRLSSTDWHRFLGFASAAVLGPGIGKRKRSPWEDEAEEDRTMRRHRLNVMDMRTALQRMTGSKTIQFRGVQAPALRAIQDGESPVVAVMPTGGGKSMLFMLPAFAEPGGATIVVIPFISPTS